MNQKLPPPPMAAKPSPQSTATISRPSNGFVVSSGKIDGPQRVVLYGGAGIGKSTLAGLAPNPVFIDIERSTNRLDVSRIDSIFTFDELRQCLQSSAMDPFDSVVIDSATKSQELGAAHVIANVKTEKGVSVTSLEGYGFGKGYQHLYDAFLLLLADCDSLIRRGKNVILIAHECVADVPNPMGENFIRFEPHLQQLKSGKSSIRDRVVQWADHVLFLGYDVIATDGKGRGNGTRTIYTSESPDHIAKSRDVSESLEFANATDGAIWPLILGGGK